ncbi:chemotaxis protein CheW [Novipirellula sp. SH528]|uniref:chemotaxis protein CheW n=1 Tax=Novipirellula sp. SH528 TaxID=3454466 RepID=UPI003F9FEAF7
MSDNTNNLSDPDDDMSEYLQTFLDETEEQLDDLVETLLLLERDSSNAKDLNEAFRLIHSIKGSAGMMGLDQMTVLTHHLENRFERFRSGTEQLDEATMNVVLRCIDFLRQSNDRLRDAEVLLSPTALLTELKRLEDQAAKPNDKQNNATGCSVVEPLNSDRISEPMVGAPASILTSTPASSPASPPENPPFSTDADRGDAEVRMRIRFRPGLQLADLKARLIVNRVAALGDLKSTQPALDDLSEDDQLEEFEIQLQTIKELAELRRAAEVDGVESIDFPNHVTEFNSPSEVNDLNEKPVSALPEVEPNWRAHEPGTEPTGQADSETPASVQSSDNPGPVPSLDSSLLVDTSAAGEPPDSDKAAGKVAETMRVEIDRLDSLMNLAGELVVNRARFVQISSQISPARRKASALNRIREFCDSLRDTIDDLENETAEPSDRGALVARLRCGLELMDEHSEIWEHDRGYLEKFGEAIDQLSRVSKNLQKGVLDTRMVPVAPLFNRFKRVVRDLSKERGKRADLLIRGDKTELDKRMIDALGDPLMHLIRNSIDHGLESTQVRLADGKPEVGTISLEATHCGNNIYIHVRDDGDGIDVGKIKAKLISNGTLSESATSELSDEQALNYIWHPGFSTAQEVTDVSGRGVGMDVVQDRIRKLNGTIQVESVPQQGTHFTIRLPLTLAIIHCLLVKIRGVVFSVPIDDVREIVSVEDKEVFPVQGKWTMDVRGEFIPLIRIDEIFHWNDSDGGQDRPECEASAVDIRAPEVVILQTAGKTVGLRVDELLGSHDMVIKSLSDNFIEIRGLSGASILGDGSVGLMLDVGAAYQMATQPSMKTATEGLAS